MSDNMHYMSALEQLCSTAGLSVQQVIERLFSGSESERIKKEIANGQIPDLSCTKKIANLFGVGVDEFYGNTNAAYTYLIGPITGNPDFMRQFETAERYLTEQGYHVFNPARITAAMPKTFMTRKQFMDIGIFMLSMCSKAVLLPGWESHSGCRMEKAYAEANGYEIMELNGENPETMQPEAYVKEDEASPVHTPNTFGNLIKIVNDTDPENIVRIVITPGNRHDAVTMTTEDALAAYGQRTVRAVEPCIGHDGEWKGYLYYIEPKTAGRFLTNPKKIPYDVPTWKTGDTAWIIEQGQEPRQCILKDAVVYPSKVFVTVRLLDTGETLSNIDIRYLFKDSESARREADSGEYEI